MQFKDLLRGSVLLVAGVATALGAISVVTIDGADDDFLAIAAFAWWAAAIGLGGYLGREERAIETLRGPLSAARTSTSLPSESPSRIALARLWPVILFALGAGGLGALLPQVPAIATGWALLVALAWRKREAAVTAIEDRDGVCFYVEQGSAFEPIRLIRTPGLMRGASSGVHPPPPPSAS